MQLIQIGNRMVNLEAITSITYEPTDYIPGIGSTFSSCIVSFGCDDCQAFYGSDAENVWRYFTKVCPALVITLTPEVVEALS